MGYPSVACLTCKKRRIKVIIDDISIRKMLMFAKCDLIKPVCGRCQRGCHYCSWDTNSESGSHFRNENAYAQGKPRRRCKARSRPSSIASTVSLPHLSLRSGLPLPLDNHAVSYWMENFVFGASDDPTIGVEKGEEILLYWKQACPGSGLDLALLAFAHAIFGRARRASEAIDEAHKLYYRAVVKINHEIRNVVADNIDGLLVATMLMGSFEASMSMVLQSRCRIS